MLHSGWLEVRFDLFAISNNQLKYEIQVIPGYINVITWLRSIITWTYISEKHDN